MRSRRWPVVLLSLRLDNPSWVDQVQGFAELARQLQQDFPDVGFVIHGMSKDGSRVWETTPRSLEAEISAASELECLLGDCEGVANAVGLSIHESVAIANLCDAFVAPLGSGMALYKWLTNKPGVVFSNQFCSDPANPQCWTRLVFEGFRDNPLPSTYVPLSAVTDVEAEHHGQRSQANFTLDRSVLHATIRNLLLSLTNLALRKPALQSSISRYSVGRTVADDARGGNNGSLSVDYGFHTATERDPWWQVDLKDLFLVQRVVIFNRLNQAERLKHFTLLGSPDGLDWTTLFRKTDGRVFGQAAEPFVAEVADGPPVRFVRVQLEGHEPLHFRECEVFGVHADARSRARMERVRSQLEKRRTYVPPGRRGAIVEISQFAVFVDENYDRGIIESLKRGDYRATECQSVIGFVKHCDRIIDLSASFGILSMTAARIAGAESLLAVHRDREAANDACDNFKRNGLEVIRSRVTILGDRRALNSPASCMNAFDSEPDIAKQGQVPVSCLEDLIDQQRATVLICDLEGGEIELLKQADLSRLRLILLKTCYSSAVDNLVGKLIASGLSLHLDRSHDGVLIMRRHEGVG
jgi:FkbM family methyltransferase